MGKSSNSRTVVARMTVTRADNSRLIVEVHSDASFHTFYHYYSQAGNQRSTKKEIRTANRNTGLPTINAHLHAPGLDAVKHLFEQKPFGNLPAVTGIRVRILRRRMYRELLSARPDVLGLVPVKPWTLPSLERELAIRLPEGFTTLKKRWSILESRR